MTTATYKGFDGQNYTATFGTANGLGVPSLKISNANGRTVRHVVMSRNEANSFFLNLDAEQEA